MELAIALAGLWLSDKSQAWRAFAQAGGQTQPEVRALAPGQPLEGELKGGQTQQYQITLSAQQFLHVIVTQRGIDVAVALIGPDGRQLFEVNGRTNESGDEIIAFIAEKEGRYQVAVRASNKVAAPGAYAVRLEALRAATSADRQRAEAEQAMREGDRLRKEQKPEADRQALKHYQTALDVWRKLGDREREADALHVLGQTYFSLRDSGETLNYAQQALSLRRALGDKAGEAQALNLIGATYSNNGKYPEAIAAYEQALPIRRALKQQGQLINLLTNIASAYANQRDYQQAVNYRSQTLPLLRELKNRREEARQLSEIVKLYGALKNLPAARETFKQARVVYEQAIADSRAADDRIGEVSLLYDLAATAREAYEDELAIKYWQQTLPLWRALNQPNNEATTLNQLGTTTRQLNQNQAARDYYQQALKLSSELKNQGLEIQVRRNLANLATLTGNNRRALDDFQALLSLVRSLEQQTSEAVRLNSLKAQEAETLNSIGAAYDDLGEREQAREHYQQALALWVELKQQGKEAVTLQNLGVVYDQIGEKQQALDSYQRALALGDQQSQAAALTNLATVYASLGEQEQARSLYQRALGIYRAGKDLRQEATVLHMLGHFYQQANQLAQARVYLERALPIRRKVEDKAGEAHTLGLLGEVYAVQGNRHKAHDYLRRSLSLHRQVGNRDGEANALARLALVHDGQGRRAQALDHLSRALRLARAVGNPTSEARIHYEMARLQLKAGDLDAARTRIEETLRLVEAVRAKVYSQELRASYLAAMHKYYDLYIDVLMRLHKRRPDEGFDGEALEASERGRARSLVEMLVEANADIRQGADPALLKRERDLQHRLNGKESRVFFLETHPTGKPETEASREAEVAALKKERGEVVVELQQVRAAIKQNNPRYAALMQPQPLTVREIQAQVLDADTLLLEYALGERRSFLWAVTRDEVRSYVLPSRAVIESLVERLYPLLSTRPEPSRRLVARGSAPRTGADSFEQVAAQLSRAILGPVAAQLQKANKQRLMIVADGALQYVPFAALPGLQRDGRVSDKAIVPLIVDYEIVTQPSASTLAILRRDLRGRQPAPKTIAVLADPVFDESDERVKHAASPGAVKLTEPAARTTDGQTKDVIATRILKAMSAKAKTTRPQSAPNTSKPANDAAAATEEFYVERLPGTRREAENILALVPPSDSLKALDFDASRALAASDDLSHYRYIHFATHGYVDGEQPELSALVFSLVNQAGEPQDGFLRAHEVYNLHLPAELVVLSACETGLGKDVRGEGLVGLTRGFMYARAARVVVSLWRVGDQTTAELMTRFYRKMLGEGQRPAAALRAAQIEMWKLKQSQAPYYWAAFTLQGEWR